jgi:hypothetical protein
MPGFFHGEKFFIRLRQPTWAQVCDHIFIGGFAAYSALADVKISGILTIL